MCNFLGSNNDTMVTLKINVSGQDVLYIYILIKFDNINFVEKET
jgi:hypothetical protein